MDELNAAQRQAVEHTDGPLLILAGAGAGKTRVIAYRVRSLVRKGVNPSNILAVTFTNKAAREMRERIQALLTSEPKEEGFPFIGTFHSFGVSVLRTHGSLMGIPKNFTIFDRSDAERMLKLAVTEAGLSPKEVDMRRIQGAISSQKNLDVSASDYGERAHGYFEELVALVWGRYQDMLKKEHALDFDDLLQKTVLLLRSHPMVLSQMQERYRYLHIDEYQDINRIQYELARLLAMPSANIAVVGDIDQNIYSWRGADIGHILNFERDFGSATVIRLLENYRSTQTIIDVSNAIIEKNKRRVEKILFTRNEAGERITLVTAGNEVDEASYVALKSRELIQKGSAPRSIAVLFRANFQSRALEEAFLLSGVPYQVIGVRFFERKEIKDLLSYLKAALYPDRISDFKRIVATPPRGIGKVALLKIVEGREAELPSKTRAALLRLRETLSAIRESAHTKRPSETIALALRISGLRDMLDEKNDEDQERIENLKELVTVASKYDAYPPLEGIEKLLEETALASDQDEITEDKNAVRLMTVHAAKGLEFDYVFITGLEDGLFPHAGREEAPDPEEERRLFYVALTRARRKLYLTYTSVRTIFGSPTVNAPSEFLLDIEDRHYEVEEGVQTIIID